MEGERDLLWFFMWFGEVCSLFCKFAMMFRYIVIIWCVCAAVMLSSCVRPSERDGEFAYTDTLRHLVDEWKHYRDIGRQDSVIITGRPWLDYYMAREDTVSVQYIGVSMAQAYVLSDVDYDTVRLFLETFRPWFEKKPNPNAASVYWNTMGHFALKYELDYADALSCYLNALEYARLRGDVSSQTIMLCNIVNIFYVRSDTHGGKFAEEAVRLSENDSVMTFNKIAAKIAMAQVRCLSQLPDEALSYLQQAHIMAMQYDISYFDPIIQMLYGDIFRQTDDYAKAEPCYASALALSANTEPSLVSQIYLGYGGLYEDMKRYDDAIQLYHKGLRVSSQTHNMEFRRELLKRLASLLYVTGRTGLAADYYMQYTEFVDSFSINSKEQELSDRQLSYVTMQHQYESARQELSLSESRRRLLAVVFIAVCVVLAATLFLGLYLKQKRMYKELVLRYEEYRQRLISENRKQDSILRTGTGSTSAHGVEMERLYLRMEELMRSGAFRDKDLSVEKLASALGSNRTYVSNTVNTMAGCTFFQYLDSYRIKEATRILSDPSLSAGVSLKALADDVGYSSPQTFHKAFKKETGVTPGVYRAEVLKIKE